jgi:AcrR family transcriptional regulator
LTSTSTSVIPTPRWQRADAERNRERVLAEAARLLAQNPAISMAEIAAASGLGRTTLYRHFPTREDLIRVLAERATAEVAKTLAASRLDEGTASQALCRLIAATLAVGSHYAFLSLLMVETDTDGGWAPFLRALCERGRLSGEFSRSLSSAWMASVAASILILAFREVALGRLDQSEALRMTTATILQALVPGIGEFTNPREARDR